MKRAVSCLNTTERPGVSDSLLPDEPTIPEPDLPEAHTPQAPRQQLVRDDSINPNDPYEGAVPPGYDWPTHGGYLGCLLGVMTSCLLGGFIGSTMFPALAHYNLMPGWVAGLLTLAVYVLLVAGIGRLGYVLGRRFLREYARPTGKTWGEDDDYDATEQYVDAKDAAEAASPAEYGGPEEASSPHDSAVPGRSDHL